jgi:hypothetical protein
MKFPKVIFLAAALATAAAPGLVEARPGYYGGHRGGGIGLGLGLGLAIGIPLLASTYYAPPYYAPGYAPNYYGYAPGYSYPPSYAVPQQGSMYFCPQLNAYYPNVRDCPGGWQQVAPQPPGR